eukprot:SRR837773.12993.p3 GENE.SRR837773.12993~~SRR837773.12993.p3  ORF type:complete len:177 (-),score=50.21 SRR837773.12993:51-560(-)
MALHLALADPAFDPDKLKQAVENFFRCCPFQAKSPAAAVLVARARLLEQLWRQRQRCEALAEELPQAVRGAKVWEARRRAAGTWPCPPHGKEADPPSTSLRDLVRDAQPYAYELGFAYAEAAAVQERHDWAARQRPPKSDAFRSDGMAGPLKCLALGELEGWWTRPPAS